MTKSTELQEMHEINMYTCIQQTWTNTQMSQFFYLNCTLVYAQINSPFTFCSWINVYHWSIYSDWAFVDTPCFEQVKLTQSQSLKAKLFTLS